MQEQRGYPSLQPKEQRMKRLTAIMKREFLKALFSILTNKEKINNAIRDRESVYITPSFIYLAASDMQIIKKENSAEGYYFIENDGHPLLCYVKQDLKIYLNFSEPEKVSEILNSIRSKKPDVSHEMPLVMFKIEDEFNNLVDVIHSIPGHETIVFTDKKSLSIAECEQKEIFTLIGAINEQACLEHSVKIDKNRINSIEQMNNKIKLSDRENLILDAAMFRAYFQMLNENAVLIIKEDMDSIGMHDEFIKESQNFYKNIWLQFEGIGLKQAPFYEPTKEFKAEIEMALIEVYMNLFKIGLDYDLREQIRLDAENLFYMHKKDNTEASDLEIRELTTMSLYNKYFPCLNNIENGFNKKQKEILINRISESVDSLNYSVFKEKLIDFNNLYKQIFEEFESKRVNTVSYDDIFVLEKKKEIEICIYNLQNEINLLYLNIFVISCRQILTMDKENDPTFEEINFIFPNKIICFNILIDEKRIQINELLLEFKAAATDVEYKSLSKLIEGQHSSMKNLSEEEECKFRLMVESINVNVNIGKDEINTYIEINKNFRHILPCLIRLAKDPDYKNEKDAIMKLIEKQKWIIKQIISDEIERDYAAEKKQSNSGWLNMFTTTNKTSSGVLSENEDRQNKLISLSIKYFDDNINFYPHISNLEKLIIIHLKREAIWILEDAIKKNCNENNEKIYKLFIKQLSSVDIDLPLNKFLNKHLKNLPIDCEDKVIKEIIEMANRNIFVPNETQQRRKGFGV